ncbi:hypothetical protein HDU99_005229 [Rhizoclosmatium hyalinum]|nr:hypothetical protein HDU99_005229 [Rhizoclosmatium hyalinum]
MLKIKHVGEAGADEMADGGAGGIRRSVIVADWLESKEDALESEEELELERKKVNGVLTRLVKKENILLEINDATVAPAEGDDGAPPELDPIIVLHPNYA